MWRRIDLVFVTTWNHYEIEVMKQNIFVNWRTNPENKAYVRKYLCIDRPINVAQDVVICLTEKNVIVLADQEYLQNKRTEIISKCHHRTKYLWKMLSNVVLGLLLKCLISYSRLNLFLLILGYNIKPLITKDLYCCFCMNTVSFNM